jgi:hypothetical protein
MVYKNDIFSRHLPLRRQLARKIGLAVAIRSRTKSLGVCLPERVNIPCFESPEHWTMRKRNEKRKISSAFPRRNVTLRYVAERNTVIELKE